MSDTLIQGAIEIANKWGIFAAIVIFFIWRGDVRERDLCERQAMVETYVRETLTKALTDSTTAITRNTDALQKLGVATTIMNESYHPKPSPQGVEK